MAYTEIYFKDWCPYSRRALALLEQKGAAFEAIDITHDTEREKEMRVRSGLTSVPQVFIDGHHIGGYDDVAALDATGELDARLSGNGLSSAA